MDLQTAKKIIEVIEEEFRASPVMPDAGERLSLREEYSGRGMYGKTTAGVVVGQSSTVWLAMGVLIERGEVEYEHLYSDNMGLATIMY